MEFNHCFSEGDTEQVVIFLHTKVGTQIQEVHVAGIRCLQNVLSSQICQVVIGVALMVNAVSSCST